MVNADTSIDTACAKGLTNLKAKTASSAAMNPEPAAFAPCRTIGRAVRIGAQGNIFYTYNDKGYP